MMEVPGANKSIYFDADTYERVQRLMEKSGQGLSQLVRNLVNEKFVQMFPCEDTRPVPIETQPARK